MACTGSISAYMGEKEKATENRQERLVVGLFCKAGGTCSSLAPGLQGQWWDYGGVGAPTAMLKVDWGWRAPQGPEAGMCSMCGSGPSSVEGKGPGVVGAQLVCWEHHFILLDDSAINRNPSEVQPLQGLLTCPGEAHAGWVSVCWVDARLDASLLHVPPSNLALYVGQALRRQ